MRLTHRSVKALEHGERRIDYRDDDLTGFFLRLGAAPSRSRVYFVYYRSPESGRRINYRIGDADQVSVVQARDAAERALGQVAVGVCPQAERVRVRTAAVVDRARREDERDAAERGRLGAVIQGPFADPKRRGRPRRFDELLARLETNYGHWFDLPLARIDEARVLDWAHARLEGRAPHGRLPTRRRAPAAEATVRRDVQDLKGVLSFAVERRLLAGPHALEGFEPFERRAEDEERVRYLEPDEERRLRAALVARTARLVTERESANAWRRARHLPELAVEVADYLPIMVLLALNTGLRRGEVFTLRWDAVDLEHRRVIVRARYAKNGRSREVPLNDEAMAVLTRWHALGKKPEAGLVFVSPRTGEQFGHIRTAWSSLMREAELENFRFHDLRHDFASKLVSKGVPLFDVGELLGHRDATTTRRYAHLAPDRKAAAVAKLNRPRLRSVG